MFALNSDLDPIDDYARKIVLETVDHLISAKFPMSVDALRERDEFIKRDRQSDFMFNEKLLEHISFKKLRRALRILNLQNSYARNFLAKVEEFRGNEDAVNALNLEITSGKIPDCFKPKVILDWLKADVLSSELLPNPKQALFVVPTPVVRELWETSPTEVAEVPSKIEDRKSDTKEEKRLNDIIGLYIEYRVLHKSKLTEIKSINLILNFISDIMGNPKIADFRDDAFLALGKYFDDIPNRNNIPREYCSSYFTRYQYAKEKNFQGLTRLSAKTIKDTYHMQTVRFFKWCKERTFFAGPIPKFNVPGDETMTSFERDAFTLEEIRKLFSLPLFTGCGGPKKEMVEGDFLYQNYIYWGYVLAFLTGMRVGEIGQLRVNDFKLEDGEWYIDFRQFDPALGRVAIKETRQLKTEASPRTVPVHELLLELGILDRVNGLKKMGQIYLFPEWQPGKKNETLAWGMPLTKSWQKVKEAAGFQRADLSMYSARHSFAHMLRQADLSDFSQKRMMGHEADSSTIEQYGAKFGIPKHDLVKFKSLKTVEIEEMSRILLGAKKRVEDGELRYHESFELKHFWSDYHGGTKKRVGRPTARSTS